MVETGRAPRSVVGWPWCEPSCINPFWTSVPNRNVNPAVPRSLHHIKVNLSIRLFVLHKDIREAEPHNRKLGFMWRAACVNERAVCTLTGRDNVLCLPGNYVVTLGPDRSAVAVDSSQLTCLRPPVAEWTAEQRQSSWQLHRYRRQIRLFKNIRLEKVVTLKRVSINERENFTVGFGW